ncbi:hypothetical protein KEM48_008706 [Puccinia striiformis f. sp. tritici PST-130]|nr:hypothetical protein KEM48_008706 [Puccinia striiformis f. sp. tritici PST-130]
MSDDDDFMMDEGGDEEYDFDYEDEDDDQEDVDTDMENKYYQAKNYKSDNPEKALADWRSIGKYQEALKTYTELLDYCKTAVTRNAAEKAINGILDYVGMAQDLDISLMQQWYEVTQNALQAAKNERLNVKIELKLAKIWMDKKEYTRLEQEIYDQTLTVKSTIPHPKIMGIIRECGGKMHMSEKNWTAAQYDFFEAFKNYDEAGSPQRISSLKYLVLAHMLMNSGIDPFDSQETKPYKQDPQIVAMTNLVAAYQRQDVHEAEKIIKNNRATILDDPFIAIYIQDVLTSLRTQWILGILQSYQRIEIAHVARQLKISDIEVEEIMLLLILDGKIAGKLDQVNGVLELDDDSEIENRHYKSLERWNSELNKLHSNLIQKSSSNYVAFNTGHQFNQNHPFYP